MKEVKELNLAEQSWQNRNKSRLLLFADIMGFKHRVQTTKHSNLVNDFSKFLKSLNSKLEPLEIGGHLKVAQFSDSIIIVANGTNEKMFNLLSKAGVTLMQMAMKQKMPIKGAIAQGQFTFIAKENLYVGKALVDAYLLHEEIKYYYTTQLKVPLNDLNRIPIHI